MRREAGTAVRKSLYDALNGEVELNSNPVGVFDGKFEAIDDIEEGAWIILGEQGYADRSNKHQFASEESIEVIIANKTKSVAGKKVVEGIGDSILKIVFPTLRTYGLTIESPFSIVFIKYDIGRANKVDPDIAKQFDNIKTINFLIHVTQ